MNNILIDNSTEQLSMINVLKECFAEPAIKTVRIATGYWDLPGLSLLADEIRSFLEKDGTSLLLMIGKDPYVYASQLKNPKYKDLSYPSDYIRTDLCDLEINEEFEKSINLLLDFCVDGDQSKIQIRIYKKNDDEDIQFLHSKCYIFDGLAGGVGYGIVGSSNFTLKGLKGNAELNYLEASSPRLVLSLTPIPNNKSHLQWFNEKWSLSEPWNKVFLEQVLKPAPITKNVEEKRNMVFTEEFTPYDLYIKLLQLKFGDVVDRSIGEQIESYLPETIQKLNYQIEAVKRCISIMHEHGGFMLGDVVGLGKTIVATLVIKHFLSVPNDDGRDRKVLIVTPPAIKSGWEKTISLFDRDKSDKISPYIDFITTGSIGNLLDDDDNDRDDEGIDDDNLDSGEFNESLQDKNYGLIIIDESHKFRNSDTVMYQSLDELIQKIGFKTGAYPYIGLLSATPQNNYYTDIKNQIYLFERNHNESTLKKAEGGNLEKFFADINRDFDSLFRRNNQGPEGAFIHDIPKDERRHKLDVLSKKIRDCVLCDILERRTRTDIEMYYKEDMESQGLVFPKIKGPNNLDYIMDDELATLFSETMTIIAPTETDKLETDDWLKYYRYRAIEYLKESSNNKKYAGRGNRDVKDVAKQLATIMQILLVKRLESSFTAFTQSLLNLRRYTENMILMWENDTIFICPQIDVNKELNYEEKSRRRGVKVSFKDCVKDIRNKIKKLTEEGRNERGQNAEYSRNDFNSEYFNLLKEDYRLISNLYDRWAKNSQDPKFDAFKESLTPILFDTQKNTSRKLVIFSEAIDTVNSLERAIKAKGYKVLKVTAANREEKEHIIEENFDANYEGEWKNDYDVIITTEVLAEGVNLHRANVILNYDTPWNSTRLMQRIGRVNRIGSKEPYIYVFNFMPSAQGDEKIDLVKKAHTKLQAFHVLFGEDSKIFTDDETIIHYDIQKVIEEEESPLQKYVFELKQFKDEHPERYNKIAYSKYDWNIAQDKNGVAYFVVKAPRSAYLAVKILNFNDENLEPHVISLLDLLEDLRVSKNTKRVELPQNWGKYKELAINAYNQYFVRINRTRAGDRRTRAAGILVELNENSNLLPKSQSLLKTARKFVNNGNYDIIKKILAIGDELEAGDMKLFNLRQEDIDELLEREIGKLISGVEMKQGEASIILGTIK